MVPERLLEGKSHKILGEQLYLSVTQVGSTSCPLARHKGESPAHIESRLEDFFQSLVTQPLAATAHGRPGYLTSGAARGT
jgi:hypothetical protein